MAQLNFQYVSQQVHCEEYEDRDFLLPNFS